MEHWRQSILKMSAPAHCQPQPTGLQISEHTLVNTFFSKEEGGSRDSLQAFKHTSAKAARNKAVVRHVAYDASFGPADATMLLIEARTCQLVAVSGCCRHKNHTIVAVRIAASIRSALLPMNKSACAAACFAMLPHCCKATQHAGQPDTLLLVDSRL